jgi:ankyrin repeat protein
MFESLKNRFNATGPSQRQVGDFTQAAANGNINAVKKFLDKHEDAVNCKDDSGSTALMTAASSGQIYVAELLLNRGADMAAKNPSGKTAQMLALGNRDLKMAKLLAQWPEIRKKRQKKQQQEKKAAIREKTIHLLLQKH